MRKTAHSLRALAQDFSTLLRTHRRVLFFSFLLIFGFVSTFYLFYPRTTRFAFAGENCASTTVLAPSLHSTDSDDNFTVEYRDAVEVFGKPLVSRVVCISPKVQPEKGSYSVSMAPLGIAAYGSSLDVIVGELPEVFLNQVSSPLPTQDKLRLPLSELDTVHEYALDIDSKTVVCAEEESDLYCDIPSLGLEQGSEYSMSVTRQFGSENVDQQIGEMNIKTLSATTIIDASIKDKEVVYTKPQEFSFTADKNLESALVGLERIEGEERAEVNGVVEIKDKTLTYKLSDELQRDAEYIVTVQDVRAFDGSSLNKPYSLQFTTSGGPKVSSVSIGSYRVAPGSTAVVQLDQVLNESTPITELASINGVAAQASYTSDKIYIPLNGLDLCESFTIRIKGELQNIHNVASSVDWSHSSRIRCHSISTIGYSVRGNAINAYSFGSGEPMLFIGAMHGNERSGGYLMDRFIDDLEANYGDIPEGRRVIVVPRVNPDAFNAITRRNANNVDLNRNFPTADWKSDVTMPGGTLIESGGGSEPLSEPESKAIANFTVSLRPKLVLTYHAVANNVIANESGISWNAAAKYAQLSGYQHVPKSSTGEVFEYDTNGAYEDWLYEKQGIATLLVELSSMSYSQFERNKPAMWAMLEL